MSILFGKGTLKERFIWAIKMAFTHGKLLAIYVFSYKTAQCIMTRFFQKESPIISFIAGVIGSQMIIKPSNKEFTSINKQLAYYLASRVIEGIFLKFQKMKIIKEFDAFKFVYVIVWGCVMYLYEKDKSILNRSMTVSMDFIYKESDEDLTCVTQLIPFELPKF